MSDNPKPSPPRPAPMIGKKRPSKMDQLEASLDEAIASGKPLPTLGDERPAPTQARTPAPKPAWMKDRTPKSPSPDASVSKPQPQPASPGRPSGPTPTVSPSLRQSGPPPTEYESTTTAISTQPRIQSPTDDESTTTAISTQPRVQTPPQTITTATGGTTKPQLQRRGAGGTLAPVKAQWGTSVANIMKIPLPAAQLELREDALRTLAGIAGSADHSREDKARARDHGLTIQTAGRPPWPAEKAMAVTAAKVGIDLLSIPENDRQLSPLGADLKSVNQTFWVKNRGADGALSPSFLCKPASKPGDGLMPSGGKRGGEVMREALAGRAAQFMATRGIDIGMPETHVVKVGGGMIPNGDPTASLTCSVQQFGASVGKLEQRPRAERANLDARQVAAIAAFDTITLANDRHAGNLLVTADNRLVPIDHGENFTEPGAPGAADRLKVTLAGTANATLGIPSAHDPMPAEIANSLKGFNPQEMADEMRADRDAIAKVHTDMGDMISDEAIAASARSAEFLKMAARGQPPISMAAAQVAVGTHMKELLNPDHSTFLTNAAKILADVARQQDAIREVCLSSNADYEMLCQEAEALGWFTQRRGETTDGGNVGDPMTMLAIVTNGTPKPKLNVVYPPELRVPVDQRTDEIKAKRKAVQEAAEKSLETAMADVAVARDSVTLADATDAMLKLRKSAVDTLAGLLPSGEQGAVAQQRAGIDAQPAAAQLRSYGDLSHDLTDRVLDFQSQQFEQIEAQFQLDRLFDFKGLDAVTLNYNYANCFQELTARNPIKAQINLDALKKLAAGDLLKGAVSQIQGKYDTRLADKFDIPRNDPDFSAFRYAMVSGRPADAMDALIQLTARANAGAFPAAI